MSDNPESVLVYCAARGDYRPLAEVIVDPSWLKEYEAGMWGTGEWDWDDPPYAVTVHTQYNQYLQCDRWHYAIGSCEHSFISKDNWESAYIAHTAGAAVLAHIASSMG